MAVLDGIAGTPGLLILPVVAFFVAGAVKGTVGLGLPATALGILTLTGNPRQAIAYVLVPMIVSNAWQAYRSGKMARTFRRYLPFLVAMCIGVWLTVNLTQSISEQTLMAILGVVVVVFVFFSALDWAPVIRDEVAPYAQVAFGVLGGIMGGLTSVWAPPIAIYLSSRRVDKTEFVRASGLLIFFGSLPLASGYISQGLADKETFTISTLLLIPTFLGYHLGERIRNRVDQDMFRKLFLAAFLLLGLNLIRRAIF